MKIPSFSWGKVGNYMSCVILSQPISKNLQIGLSENRFILFNWQFLYMSIWKRWFTMGFKGSVPKFGQVLAPIFLLIMHQIAAVFPRPGSWSYQEEISQDDTARRPHCPPRCHLSFWWRSQNSGEMKLFYLFGGSYNKANLGMILRITMSYCHV